LSWWNEKIKEKKTILGHFAESGSRQRDPLPSAMAIALGKAGKLANRTAMFPDLPRVMAIALGKGIVLLSANLAGSRQRFFLKREKLLCREPFRQALSKCHTQFSKEQNQDNHMCAQEVHTYVRMKKYQK
jgi:hypothetical protein